MVKVFVTFCEWISTNISVLSEGALMQQVIYYVICLDLVSYIGGV